MRLTAEEVLREQVALADRFTSPDASTLGYVQSFAKDKLVKNDQSTVWQLFYPFDVTVAAEAKAYAKAMGLGLQASTAYQVTAEMVDLATALYRDQQKRGGVLDGAELPSDYGFMWLDKSPDQRDQNGRSVITSAITWSKLPVRTRFEHSEEVVPGVRLTFWTSWTDLERLDEWTEDTYQQAMERSGKTREEIKSGLRREFGNLTFSHTVVLPFGVDIGVTTGEIGDSAVALVHVLWMLMDMEFVTSRKPAQLPRAARRRALRSLKHGEVNVILLRRTKTLDDGDHDPAPVEWSCRWIVQGHWRTYKKDGRRIWIRPYIKGPDGLPVKDTKQLWRLAR